MILLLSVKRFIDKTGIRVKLVLHLRLGGFRERVVVVGRERERDDTRRMQWIGWWFGRRPTGGGLAAETRRHRRRLAIPIDAVRISVGRFTDERQTKPALPSVLTVCPNQSRTYTLCIYSEDLRFHTCV